MWDHGRSRGLAALTPQTLVHELSTTPRTTGAGQPSLLAACCTAATIGSWPAS